MTSNQISHPDSNSKEASKLIDRPHNKLGKYLYLLLGIGGAGLILLLARPMLTSSSDSPPETAARALPVEIIKVQPVDSYQVSRIYTGEISALRTSNLGFSHGGEIEQVLVEEGDRVKYQNSDGCF